MRLIDVDDYCKNRCICNRKHCEKEKCSVYLAPVIDPESLRPQGEYIPDMRYRGVGNCSLCGEVLTFLNKFCPNCGAKMKGK